MNAEVSPALVGQEIVCIIICSYMYNILYIEVRIGMLYKLLSMVRGGDDAVILHIEHPRKPVCRVTTRKTLPQ